MLLNGKHDTAHKNWNKLAMNYLEAEMVEAYPAVELSDALS